MRIAASPLTLVGVALALVGAGISGYLTYTHGSGGSPVCGPGQGCEVVAQSTYAELWGLPTAAYGLLLYLSLAVLFGVRLIATLPPRVEWGYRQGGLALALAGTGVSAWLTYVEVSVLYAICLWCVVSAAVITGVLAVCVVEAARAR